MARFLQVALVCLAYSVCIATLGCSGARAPAAGLVQPLPADGEEEVVQFREGTSDDDVIAQLREQTPELFHTDEEVERVNSEFTSRYVNPFDAFVRPPCCSTLYSIRVAPNTMTDIYGTTHTLLASPFIRQYYRAGSCRSFRPHQSCKCCRRCGVSRRIEQFWVWQRNCPPGTICFQLKCFYVDDQCECTRINRPIRPLELDLAPRE